MNKMKMYEFLLIIVAPSIPIIFEIILFFSDRDDC